MNRTRGFGVLTALILSTMLAVSTAAQQLQKSEPAQASAKIRTYAPRIKSRSSSFIVEGIITRLQHNSIIIKTAQGARYNLELDEQTSVLNSGELVSIATMADIALNTSDLRVSDHVEIVTERVGRREVARIITRISSSDSQVAKR